MTPRYCTGCACLRFLVVSDDEHGWTGFCAVDLARREPVGCFLMADGSLHHSCCTASAPVQRSLQYRPPRIPRGQAALFPPRL